MASSSPPPPPPKQQSSPSKALSDHIVITRLSLCHSLDMDIRGLKAQILEMETKGYGLDQIRDYLTKQLKAGYLQKKNQDKKEESSSLSTKKLTVNFKPEFNNNDDKEDGKQQQPDKIPYFRMLPPVQTYEVLELNLIILHQLYNASRERLFIQDHPYDSNPVKLWQFVDDCADAYSINLPQNAELKQIRLEWYKKKSTEEGIDFKDLRQDDWLDSLPIEQQPLASQYRDVRSNVKVAINEHLYFLNKYSFIQIDEYSAANRENLIKDKAGNPVQAITKDSDRITLLRKGWTFLLMYMHTLDQRNPQACFGYMMSLAQDKNSTW